MKDIKKLLAEVALERSTRYATIFVKQLPDPEELEEYTMLGSYSFSLQETRRRLISTRMEILPGIFETPAAISRDYLRLIYGRGPRFTKKQIQVVSQLPPEPNIAYPQTFIYGYYVDIKSCYWSIMNIIGWNVDYNPGLWLYPGKAPSDYPFPEHKIGRNCLVSAGMMQGIPVYNPHWLPREPYSVLHSGNVLQNYQLVRLIHDILNSIAVQALSSGAVYANKDGFICPTAKSAQSVKAIIADWGLSSTIKAEGPGEIKASGTYQVGTAKTLNYEKVASPHPMEILYRLPYMNWLQDEFSFYASKKGD
jgi:hypothetical protein